MNERIAYYYYFNKKITIFCSYIDLKLDRLTDYTIFKSVNFDQTVKRLTEKSVPANFITMMCHSV